MVSAEDFVPSL